MAKKGKDYVDRKQFYQDIVESLEKDELTPRAQKSMNLIAERACRRLPYKDPEDRKDCIMFAKMDLFKYWRNFNTDYDNPFAYYTEIAKKGYIKGWYQLHPKKYKGTLRLSGGEEDSDGIYTV
jgi:hypothetical protein